MISLPPDKFNRFHVASHVIRSFDTINRHAYVLDLGSNENLLSSFLNEYQIIQGDIQRNTDAENFVQLQAESTPFADKSFEVVVCLDVLEHVHESFRESVLNEIVRITSHSAIIAFPVDHDDVVQSEILLARIWEEIYHTPNVFLEEHRRFGLIKTSSVNEFMQKHFSCVKVISTFPWHMWLLSQLTSQFLGFLPDTETIRDTVFMLMNIVSSQIQNEQSAYRAFVIGSHKTIPEITSPIPGFPPFNSLTQNIVDSFLSVKSSLKNLSDYSKELEKKLNQTTLELERALHSSKSIGQKYETLLARMESSDSVTIENNYRTLEKYALHLENVLSSKDRMIIDLQRQLTNLLTGDH